MPERLRDVRGRQHPAGGAGLQRRDGRALSGARDAAVALHREDVADKAAPPQLVLEAAQVTLHARADERVDERGVRARVLSRDAREAMAVRHVDARAVALVDERRDALLVDRVRPGVQQAYRERADTLGLDEPLERAHDVAVAERDHDRSTDVDALEDSFGPRARDERHGLGERRGVPDLLLGETVDAPDRPHDRGRVLEAARRDEAEDRAGAREEGVRRDRAPVGDPPGPPEQLDEVDAEPRSAALERREDAVGRIGGRGRGLRHAHMPGRVQQRDVGERPADVDPDDDRGPQLVLIAGAGPRTP